MIWLLACILAVVECYDIFRYNCSGYVLAGERVVSNIGNFTLKYYQIPVNDFDETLTVTLEASSAIAGDVLRFLVTNDVSSDIPADLNLTSKWTELTVLTLNESTLWDADLELYRGDIRREWRFKFPILANITAASLSMSYKILVLPLQCSETSLCEYALELVKDTLPWRWILLGVLGGLIVFLGVIAALLCLVRCLCCREEKFQRLDDEEEDRPDSSGGGLTVDSDEEIEETPIRRDEMSDSSSSSDSSDKENVIIS